MKRATFLFALLVSAVSLGVQGQPRGFTVVEATIPQMMEAMAKKQVTSRQLVEQYLIRIAMYEDRLNAALAINAHALAEADALDRERAQGKLRGPLHGIPVALKDNIHTTDMPTTGGALVFAGYVPPYEATLTKNLKAAGAIIIAKTGLTELANWVAGNPNAMPGNYNAVGGFGFNPYDPRPDPRPEPGDGRPVLQTGGSSSGIGTAANFWAGNVGSDTGGSIISPSNANMLVGIRPTIGRISRYGVIPITADHDTAGPDDEDRRRRGDHARRHGRRVTRCQRRGDPHVHAAAESRLHEVPERRGTERRAHRRTARVLHRSRDAAGRDDAARRHQRGTGQGDGGGDRGAEAARRDRRRSRRRPELRREDGQRQFSAVGFLLGRRAREGQGRELLDQLQVRHEARLQRVARVARPVRPGEDAEGTHRDWNVAHAKAGAIKYGQSRFDISDEIDLAADKARLDADDAKDRRLSRDQGIDGVLKQYNLDAFITPGGSGAGIASRAGYPIIAVPFGLVPNAPQQRSRPGFNAKPAPFGVGFVGAQCSEPKLIEIAFAFEQATKKRIAPPLVP